MKRLVFFTLMTLMVFGSSYAQKRDKKKEKLTEIHRLDQQSEDKIATLLASKEFEFFAQTVFPMGMTPRDIGSDHHSVRFSEDEVVSDLPYFGTVRSGVGFGRDKGLRFSGAPTDFKIEKSSKNYLIHTTIRTEKDSYKLSMAVAKSGYATLTISSRNKETISFQGEIK